jgi:hypothetical protein
MKSSERLELPDERLAHSRVDAFVLHYLHMGAFTGLFMAALETDQYKI